MTAVTQPAPTTAHDLRAHTPAAGPRRISSSAHHRPTVDLEVVIPALNEEARLPATLRATVDYLATRPWSSAVVVVDNGSVDRTAEVVRAAMRGPVPVHLVGCAGKGKGAAVRRGFETGTAAWTGFMDADLATPVETLDRVVPLLQGGATAVIGSRSVPDAERVVPQGFVRRMGGEAFRATARAVLPDVADTQCGFKFFDGAAVRDALRHCTVDGFSFDLELLARLWHTGHDVVEVPVTWTDKAGSSFSPLKHGVRSFADTVRLMRQAPAASAGPGRVPDLGDGTRASGR